MSNTINIKIELIISKIIDIQQFTIAEFGNGIYLYKELPSVDVKYSGHPELAFIKVVSWLYILYFELAKSSLTYIDQKNKKTIRHKKDIQIFRTFFQHHLSLSSDDDKNKIEHCELWFYERIEKKRPKTNLDWEKSLNCLLDDVTFVWEAISEEIMQKANNTEFKDITIFEWKRTIDLSFSSYEYEKNVKKVFVNYGIYEYSDVNRFCKKNLSNWQSEVKNTLTDIAFFDQFVSSLVEKAVMDSAYYIPISGSELMSEFNLPSGPMVKELLQKACDLFWEEPCSKQILLLKLKNYLQEIDDNVA